MADVTVELQPPEVNPGDTVTLVVALSGPNVVEGGIALLTPGVGTWTIPAGEPLSISGDWVTQNQPKAAVDGRVEFHVDWTAPGEVGVTSLEVMVLGANGDGRTSGDRAGAQTVTIGYGCEPLTLYWDSDGDGFGQTEAWRITCSAEPDYVAVPGDCASNDPARHPGAAEQCNGLDDDCDGATDEAADGQSFHWDADGDGYGDPSRSSTSCVEGEPYVANALDCDDRSAAVNPAAIEACDVIDNDCNGETDEAGCADDQICRAGACVSVGESSGPASSAPSTSLDVSTNAPPSDSGSSSETGTEPPLATVTGTEPTFTQAPAPVGPTPSAPSSPSPASQPMGSPTSSESGCNVENSTSTGVSWWLVAISLATLSRRARRVDARRAIP